MKAASLQFFATPFDLTRNLETAERLIRQAAGQGAQLAVLPEMFNTGYVYTPRLFAFAEADDGLTLRNLQRLSAELRVHLAGTLLLRDGSQVFNTFVLVEPGGRIHRYRKQHPFLWEHCYFAAGRGPLIAATELGRLGLMVCWDIAHRAVWEQYRGQVDVLLLASSAPRLHRALLNFPLGRKVYLAELMPWLLRRREEIDRWYGDSLAARAAWLGAPIVHSVMAGRFVAEAPFPRLSFLAAALRRPRYWPLVAQAHLAGLRATFYGTSAVYGAAGETLARVESEEGAAVAEAGPTRAASAPWDESLLRLPASFRLAQRLLAPLARGYYRRHRAPPA